MFVTASFSNWPTWEQTLLQIESQMISLQPTVRSMAAIVQPLTFVNPVAYVFTESADIEGPLCGPVLEGYAPTTAGWSGLTLLRVHTGSPISSFIVHSGVMVARVLQHPGHFWPVEATLQFMIAAEFNECKPST